MQAGEFMERRRELFARVRRAVVKIGTAALTAPGGGLDERRLEDLTRQVHALRQRGVQVAVVSSGAIGAGMDALGLTRRPSRLPELQACAAVGQGRLTAVYDRCFRRWGYNAAQILLTREDIDDRRRYLNASNAINAVIEYGAVPLINENDTISVEEITFGDNDGLAALVTHLLRADVLILLTVVEGLYENPEAPPGQRRILDVVERVDDTILALASASTSRGGRGGMASKVEAARVATAAGEAVVIAHAHVPRVLERIFDGERIGTLFLPAPGKMRSRSRWLRFGTRPKGQVIVDAGARAALLEAGKSLLPSGIRSVRGSFARGDIVSIVDESGREIGRGLVNYSSEEIALIKGHRTADIRRILGDDPYKVVVHRDHLVLDG